MNRNRLKVVSLQEGLGKVKALANSEDFLRLTSTYGKKPDGENRIVALDYPLQHLSLYGRTIKREGFDPEKRNPYIFGFSFDEDEGGEEEVEIGENVPIYDEDKGYEEPVEILDKLSIYKVSIFLIGPVWKPSRNGEKAFSFYLGVSADPKWNFLVKEAAEEVGSKFFSYSSMRDEMINAKIAKLQRKFVEAIRQRLLKAGIVGIHLGSELVAVDFEAIHIIEEEQSE